MRIGLISDTHGRLRNEVFDRFDGVGLILHAGDIGAPGIVAELEAIAPVRAVHGNTDGFEARALYPEQLEVAIENRRIALVHGHLLDSLKPPRLRQLFPGADVIVYGHTHAPLLDAGPPLVVNPGAAGPARFHHKPSVAVLELPALRVTFLEL